VATQTQGVRIFAVAAAVTLLGAACANEMNSRSGDIEISGSSTVEPVSTWVAEEYEMVDRDVLVNVDGPGTGDGFELFCNGETDISDASRPMKAAEVEKCEANGVGFIELKVAIDGLAVITNDNNDAIECLALEDIYALVGPESQGFSSWSDAQDLAAELGSDTRFPSAPLDVTAPGEESGTFDSFVEIAIAPIGKKRAEAGAVSEADARTTRPDYVSQSSDNVIIQSVTGSNTSFGWVGYSYASQASGVKLVAVEDADGNCVAPTTATIASGDYPLARDLYIYVNAERATDSDMDGFVSFYMDNLTLAAESVGYVPLGEDAAAATRMTWQNRTTGTVEGGE
jgi:phosphate transport system substrate-binding protein